MAIIEGGSVTPGGLVTVFVIFSSAHGVNTSWRLFRLHPEAICAYLERISGQRIEYMSSF